MNESFAERMAYWQFRAVVRATSALGSIKLRRLKDLLKLAAYDELRAQGKNKAGVAVSLGVSQALITDISSRLHKPALWPEAEPMAKLIPELLFDNGGSLDEFALEDLLYTGVRKGKTGEDEEGGEKREAGFYYRMELALRELGRWGVVERRQQGAEVRFHLTERGEQSLLGTLNQPMSRELERMEVVIALGEFLLAHGEVDEETLVTRCGAPPISLPEARVRDTLRWCREAGDAGERSPIQVRMGPTGLLYSPSSEASIHALDPIDEWQLGILSLIRRHKDFLGWIAGEPDSDQISLQMLSFRHRPEDLSPFLTDHMAWVRERIRAMEEAAGDGETERRTYEFSWFGLRKVGAVEPPPQRSP